MFTHQQQTVTVSEMASIMTSESEESCISEPTVLVPNQLSLGKRNTFLHHYIANIKFVLILSLVVAAMFIKERVIGEKGVTGSLLALARSVLRYAMASLCWLLFA